MTTYLTPYHNHYTKAQSNLTIPRFSLAGSQTSFIYQVVKVWNSLSNGIKNLDSMNTFKVKF